jgi:ABC-type bacteriocin/lantibiotic exporter with double-glycine peptidase domain
LIFDEATNALDAKTESRLIDNLHDLPGGITKIIITHGKINHHSFDRILRVSEKRVDTLLP